jgi:hypothetical protein
MRDLRSVRRAVERRINIFKPSYEWIERKHELNRVVKDPDTREQLERELNERMKSQYVMNEVRNSLIKYGVMVGISPFLIPLAYSLGSHLPSSIERFYYLPAQFVIVSYFMYSLFRLLSVPGEVEVREYERILSEFSK